MDQGIYTASDHKEYNSHIEGGERLKVKYSPTLYDRQTLLNKWKGNIS